MGVRLLTAMVLALTAAGAPEASAQSIRVTPVATDGRIRVTFLLADGFTDELRAAIRSGLPTTIVYEIELRRPSIWFDRTIASAEVSVRAEYDNLTRRYQVTRMQDGRLEWTRPAEREPDVRAWMTEFDRLPLFSTAGLEPNVEYYVRVRAQRSPRDSWFWWPWGRDDASGRAKFTFIP
jgi:hypothetical protein